MRSVLALGFLLASSAAGVVGATGCVRPPAAQVAFEPLTVVMPTEPTAAAPATGAAEPELELALDLGSSDAGAPALPILWAVAFGHTRPFRDAIRVARSTRAELDGSTPLTNAVTDGGVPSPKRFERARAMLDQGSRAFAAAYHAPDASAADAIDALREGADMLLAWSRRLDEVGLSRAPSNYRTDTSVALSFDDVANGPAKRWREEGMALVSLCVERARAASIDTASARACTTMRQTYARVMARRRDVVVDGGVSGCACDPGDPLCSASMSGWCRPK